MKNLRLLVSALLLCVTASLSAQTAPVDDNGLAIGGYDVVGYFTSAAAIKGNASIKAVHKGVTYWFSSQENKALFQKEPTKYLPQCGGYCAWGVAEKKSKFPINPETFDIVDGKLYFFFNGPFKGEDLNTMQPWNKETSRLVEAANSNWKEMETAK